MTVRKKYQSLGGSPLSVQVLIEGCPVSVEFTGGMKHPLVRLPIFATSDEKLQRALEDYPGYGKSFHLIEWTEAATQKPVLGIKQFPNLATAKAYLKKNYNMPIRNGQKHSEIEEIFTGMGFELKLES